MEIRKTKPRCFRELRHGFGVGVRSKQRVHDEHEGNRSGALTLDVPADKLTVSVINKYLELKGRGAI